MARMFNNNKVRNFFQKKKQILVDGCCDTETCCGATTGTPCGFNIYFTDKNYTDVEITTVQAPFVGSVSTSVGLLPITFEIYAQASPLIISNINVTNVSSAPTLSSLPITPYTLSANSFGDIVTISDVSDPFNEWSPGQNYDYIITFTIQCGAIIQNATINLVIKS